MKIAGRQIGSNIIIEVLESRFGADKVVEFVDSSGLGAILSLFKRMPKGCNLIICGATDSVTSMFRLTRLDRIFTMKKNVDEAVNALSV
jgi:anti-anti-sigma regulatory factor